MKKFKVELIKTEKFVIDILAKNETEAKIKIRKKWNEIKKAAMEHNYQIGNPEVKVNLVYDVTDTDDPFNP